MGVRRRRLLLHEQLALTECDEGTLHKSKTPDRALRSNALFVRFLVLVLSPPRRTVLVLESIQYSNPTYWSASSREPLRSTIGIAAVQTAVEYEYRFAEYEYRFAEYEYRFAEYEYCFAEYEYDEIRCEARTKRSPRPPVGSSDRKHSFIS